MKVLVLYTLPPDVTEADRSKDEFVLSAAADNVASVLPQAKVAGIRGDAHEVLAILQGQSPDVVFNVCEAPLGRPDLEAHIAALFEWVGIRFTGCGSETLALCRRKDRTGAVLSAAGVPVPRQGSFPCIVKPVDGDGSAGICAESICSDEAELRRAQARLGGNVIVEQFLPGREFVISLWGDLEPDYVSIGETTFLNGLRLLTYTAKWDESGQDYADSPLNYDSAIDTGLKEAILQAARGAWRAVRARGYLRLDIRLDERGDPYVLDVNPNPEIGPDKGICRAVQEAGWKWERFVRQQVEWARCL